MKNKYALFSAIIAVSLLISCGDKKNNKLILGKWDGVEWLVNGKPSENNAKNTHFTFNEKGEYSFMNSGTTEKGIYKVENDMLFTTPEKQQEIMVKIAKLTKDSLVFDMNRGGQPETLTLLKGN